MSKRKAARGSLKPPRSYAEWRIKRFDERQQAADPAVEHWNYLITVVVEGIEADDGPALRATLASLQAQTYRNVEVLVLGPSAPSPEDADFARHRGLFHEPTHAARDLLADAACDRLWRGDYIVFARAGTTFDADAFQLLNAAANRHPRPPDLVVADHDRIAPTGEHTTPSFLPGWDPDAIQCLDYVGTAFMASRALVALQRLAAGPKDLDAWLGCVGAALPEVTSAHVTETIFHFPTDSDHPTSRATVASHPQSLDASRPLPRVAIVMTSHNRPDLLQYCLKLMELPKQFAVELVIVDNASDNAETLAIYDDLRRRYDARIVAMNRSFNFSCMMNLGVAATTAEVLLLMNNDVNVTAPGLLEQMVAHALRPEVGVVGSKLIYPDGTIQHGGMLLRQSVDHDGPVLASHVLRGAARFDCGYLRQLDCVRNYQSVTGAILALRREVFDSVNGLDEVALPVEYNDVDLCLKIRREGLRVIMLPLDGIIHHDGATRCPEVPSPAVLSMRKEAQYVMQARWPDCFANDPYRNPWVDMNDVPEARFPWSAGHRPVSGIAAPPALRPLPWVRNELKRTLHRLGRSANKRLTAVARRYLARATWDLQLAAARARDASIAAEHAIRYCRAPTRLRDGLCLSGYLRSEIGLGQAVRCLAHACDTQRLPVSMNSLPLPRRDNETEFRTKCNPAIDRKLNMLVVGLPSIVDLDSELRGGRKHILYPFWELGRIPEEWRPFIRRFDQVWAPSTFVASAFEEAFGQPVRVLRQPMLLPRQQPSGNPSPERLSFLTYLDFDSFGARKNPQAAVMAFQHAFGQQRTDVELVVKTRGLDDGGLRQWLAGKAAADPRIRVVDRTLDRAGMDALMAASSVYVSLHRSEGFGFGAAEALTAGKAVIATDYSATTDFINESTGYPVAYDLVAVKPGEYISHAGQVWADPRVESAAAAMRSIYDDFAQAQSRTRRGFELLKQRHDAPVIGAEIAALLGQYDTR